MDRCPRVVGKGPQLALSWGEVGAKDGAGGHGFAFENLPKDLIGPEIALGPPGWDLSHEATKLPRRAEAMV